MTKSTKKIIIIIKREKERKKKDSVCVGWGDRRYGKAPAGMHLPETIPAPVLIRAAPALRAPETTEMGFNH
jgi:hypothetical protein